jgi:hypothetical protein
MGQENIRIHKEEIQTTGEGKRGREEGRIRKSSRGVNTITEHSIYVWKCHGETMYNVTYTDS